MAIIKYILLSILISYLLRSILSPFYANQTGRKETPPPPNPEKKKTKPFTDKLGEYTDYEEIK